MKKILFLLAIAWMAQPALFAQHSKSSLNVLSYNIRYDNASDGENQWKNRKDFAAALIRFHEAAVVGAQEVLHHQLTDLLERLPGYAYVGVGREDGKTKGEYAPILYKKDRLEMLRSGNFWLAEDIRAVGKKGWDAACERVATWAVFRDKATGKEFFFLNTHLDHMGKVARHEGAELVLEQTRQLAGSLPVIVTGDFNAAPQDEPIQVLTRSSDARHLTHSRAIADFTYGPEWTFHDFGKIPLDRREWIDYIFIKGPVHVSRHAVLTETSNRLYPSDHCPVLCTLEIR